MVGRKQMMLQQWVLKAWVLVVAKVNTSYLNLVVNACVMNLSIKQQLLLDAMINVVNISLTWKLRQ
jgi:hypothetical protein